MIDPNYQIKCDFIIDKKTYEKLLSHLFRLEQVFRTFAFMAERHRAKHMPSEQNFDVKKEAYHALLRTSQAHFSTDLGKLCDAEINGVKGMSLRLQMKHARAIFDAKMLPVIDSKDPLTFKFIRMKHQLGGKKGERCISIGKPRVKTWLEVKWVSHGIKSNCM